MDQFSSGKRPSEKEITRRSDKHNALFFQEMVLNPIVAGRSGLVRIPCRHGWGYLVPACESTMDLAWDLYQEGGFPAWTWVLAENQTRGRGRMGRPWVSGPGSLSVTLRLPDHAAALEGMLSLAVALVLIRALGHLDVAAVIKWPNDIVTGGCKTGGILIEERQGILMAGIGMNLDRSTAGGSHDKFFRIPAGCLAQSGVNISPFRLWQLFSDSFRQHLPGMIADPAQVVEQVNTCLAWKNQFVVMENTGSHDGPARILGVDNQGRLKIRTGQGDFYICSGMFHPRVI
jgi:BirA family transcriptional regulator, biotin operon repressor / biotin---[acetyl-CoA-carboxylase] ligase